ncbi:RraA family protein [Thermomicrobiaceae bacterium CFH 74404]|uniref:Putative 4-hydroxy-4-methyl-2-oxoglutarate aldolase n=1 Tax=Thermalbibacter longus TaxID=2951981 RepID=A0AA41WB31_9BACT|nr:RraA family protein [Thermalbibacter longus]MCM8748252.1 RraA family protein [Thermalbibacter longus]
MAQGPLSPAVLRALQTLNTPTVANAIETFNLRPRNQGFMDASVRCMLPGLGVMVGYAVTAKIRAAEPPAPGAAIPRRRMWEYILSIPEPRVVVIQDLDDPPVGSFWGEVNANIHRALGCVGTVTNGGVRDLDEVEQLGFHLFASQVHVSHAYVHVVEIGTPVEVGGLTVHPGDLLHGDKHGVIQIPLEIAPDLFRAAKEVEARERRIIEVCQSPDFSIEKLSELYG